MKSYDAMQLPYSRVAAVVIDAYKVDISVQETAYFVQKTKQWWPQIALHIIIPCKCPSSSIF